MYKIVFIIFYLKKIDVERALAKLNHIITNSHNDYRYLYDEILKYHIQNNFYFSSKYFNLLEERVCVPSMTKHDFQVPLKEIISKSISFKNCYISSTSGSSGHPFFFAKDREAHALTWANIIYHFSTLGISVFDFQARFYGIPTVGFPLLKERLKDFLLARYRFNIFDVSEDAMNLWLNVFKKKKFKYINGYTSSITLFARFCIKEKVLLKSICPTLKICIVTSETCSPEDKIIIQEAFGIPVVREYGASEIDLIALEDLEGNWKICESNVYVEVVDDQGYKLPDGHEGRILVTSLHNKAMPFIRYEIGDRGILGTTVSGERILVQLTGRTNDMVYLPSGKIAAGLTFYYISRTLLEKGGFLKEFIIKQKKLDFFEYEIVAERDLTTDEISSIQLAMDRYLEPGLNFSIKRVNFIERKGSGKIKHFFSELTSSKN